MWVWKFRMENNDWFLWLILKVFQLQSFFRGEWFLDRLICWNRSKWKTINFLNQIFYSIFLIEFWCQKRKLENLNFDGFTGSFVYSRILVIFRKFDFWEKKSISSFAVDPQFQCKYLTQIFSRENLKITRKVSKKSLSKNHEFKIVSLIKISLKLSL